MKNVAGKACLGLAVLILIAWGVGWRSASGQERDRAGGEAPKIAGQQFKNLQVLKDIPADQLIPTMQFITASLGVECDFCHVEHQMEKDDKKEKKTARAMMEMQLAIDKTNFKGDLEVTCYTCHRGAAHPVGTPIPVADPNAKRPAPHVHEEGGAQHADLPTADQILDKYLAAVGGADALMKVTSRVQKGTIEAMGTKSAIEVYSQAPDKRVSIAHMNGGDSVTAFNGQVGWLTFPGGVHWMTTSERESAGIDAQMYFAAKVRDLYKEFRVRPGEEIDGRATYPVFAAATPGHPAIRMYFDQQTGLLLRLIRYTETALGRMPAEVEYADYQETDGVKIPYRWTLARPNGAFAIQIDQVRQNVAVDPKRFEPPAENLPPAH